MPIICWGNLAKSADDTLRIEQSIEDYVEGHNINPNAHQIEGSALYMHRVEADLDHPFGSVSFKHLLANNILISTCFDTFDGWDTAGTKYCHVFDSNIMTAASQNATAWAQLYTEQGRILVDPTKNPYFQTTVYFLNNTSQNAYIMLGGSAGGPEGSAFGFKVVNASLYACWYGDGAEQTALISGVDITQPTVLRAYCDSENKKIYFYVNGVLKYTADTHYPSGTNTLWFIYWIKTTTTAVRYLCMVDLYIEQDR